MDRINLADAFGLDGPDEPTTAAIARIGYTIQVAPGKNTPLLGEGAYAEVFYARHSITGRMVAIKVFRDTPDALQVFENETGHLENPKFPTAFALCSYGSYREPNARPFIVMEYVRGQPINEYSKNMPVPQRVALLEQAAKGLAAVHKIDLAHRDIHADNVVVTDDGQVRWLDFGLSGTDAPRHKTIDARGNRDCTPPEVQRGRRADQRDDVYSLSALSIQVLTGVRMPENNTHSGDPAHVAKCRKLLAERQVDSALGNLLLAGLESWERRTVLAETLASQWEDWRVHRPLRRRTRRTVTTASLLVVTLFGAFAWYVQAERDRLQRRDVEVLRAEVSRLSNADHPAVARLVVQASESTDIAAAKELLRRALRIGQSLEGSRLRRETLGVALNDTAWTQLDAITQRCKELRDLYSQARSELESGEEALAGKTLDKLQQALAELTKENVAAGPVSVAKQQYDQLAKLIPDRLRQEKSQELSKLESRAKDGLASAAKRKWSEAALHFGQARTQLLEWLQKEMTSGELAALRQATDDQLKVLEQEVERLKSELARAERQRDDQQLKRQEYEGQIAKLSGQSVADRDAKVQAESQVSKLSTQLERESASRSAAEAQVAKQSTELQRLGDQKKTIESQLAATQVKADRVPQLEADLKSAQSALAQEQGRSEQLSNAAKQFKIAADKAITDVKAAEAARAKAARDLENAPPKGPAPPVKSLTQIGVGTNAGDVLTLTVAGIPVRFRWCPAGTFQMGSPAGEKGRDDDETQRSVTLTKGFWLMETECWQKLWVAVMGSELNWSTSYGEGDAYPVYNVSHDQAVEFCKKLQGLLGSGVTVSLPTEAQWEYACRAGAQARYSFGDDESKLGEYAWYVSNSGSTSHPVAQKKPNAWGLYDMHGNVWEWCSDWYSESSSGGRDPVGPLQGSLRVDRGGCWYFTARNCRSANRSGNAPVHRRHDLGFRFALSPSGQ